jgi:hypothetical protein
MIHNNSGSSHYNKKTTVDDREKDRPTSVSSIARVTVSRPEQALKFQTAQAHQKCLKGFSGTGFTEIHGWSLSTKGWSKSSNRQEKKSRIAKEQRVTAGENTHEHRYTNFCIHEFERALSRCHRPLLTHPHRWSMRQYHRRKRPAPVTPKPDRTKLAAMCVVRKNAQSSTCAWSNQRWNKRIHMMCSSTKQRTRTALISAVVYNTSTVHERIVTPSRQGDRANVSRPTHTYNHGRHAPG